MLSVQSVIVTCSSLQGREPFSRTCGRLCDKVANFFPKLENVLLALLQVSSEKGKFVFVVVYLLFWPPHLEVIR